MDPAERCTAHAALRDPYFVDLHDPTDEVRRPLPATRGPRRPTSDASSTARGSQPEMAEPLDPRLLERYPLNDPLRAVQDSRARRIELRRRVVEAMQEFPEDECDPLLAQVWACARGGKRGPCW